MSDRLSPKTVMLENCWASAVLDRKRVAIAVDVRKRMPNPASRKQPSTLLSSARFAQQSEIVRLRKIARPPVAGPPQGAGTAAHVEDDRSTSG
ncbi:hypothetical protein GCM10011611_08930 [Aliidongia dinghuensis]|uniref:Uncharacterized protein n=1 Tax=Aliidongia dinghuensis TaxID=1867774 RepID=A0A8J2YPR7_9PROT|nr:hypothetical protein GCM10011611_08930 [Aliidongia dinghuensis]